MPSILVKNRTIRPSSRKPTSSYRVRVVDAAIDDIVFIFIDHESADFRAVYKTTGIHFQNTDSINFKVEGEGKECVIVWSREIELERVK